MRLGLPVPEGQAPSPPVPVVGCRLMPRVGAARSRSSLRFTMATAAAAARMVSMNPAWTVAAARRHVPASRHPGRADAMKLPVWAACDPASMASAGHGLAPPAGRQDPAMASGAAATSGTGGCAARRRCETSGVRRAGRFGRLGPAAPRTRSVPQGAQAARRGSGGCRARATGRERARGRRPARRSRILAGPRTALKVGSRRIVSGPRRLMPAGSVTGIEHGDSRCDKK